MDKQNVLQGALALNASDKKFNISVENDCIITTVKWMDAVLFGADSITDEMKQFKFIVKLNDDCTWTETDVSSETTKSASTSGFGMKYSSFKGKEISFNKTIAIGKNKENDSIGVVKAEFYSEDYKKPIREYLESCGYKKAKKGFWKTLFGR